MPKPLRVWMPRSSGSAFDRILREQLPPLISVNLDARRPEPADYHVLVDGVPAANDLAASASLHTVVIPWAGVAKRARETLLAFPTLTVCNLHHNAASTAETAIGLLLAAARNIVPADRAFRAGDWSLRFELDSSMRLMGRRAVVLGVGAIGTRVARTLRAMDMHVSAVSRSPKGMSQDVPLPVFGRDDLDANLQGAHVLVVCVAATPETTGLLDARRLALLAPSAIVVNVSRGIVIEERALYEALHSGRLGGAGLDVWYRYPRTSEERKSTLPSEYPFHELDSVVMSPHRAGHDGDTDRCRAEALAATLIDVAAGNELDHVVNLKHGY